MAPTRQVDRFVTNFTLPDPFTVVIFGATGDLTARKLLPALYGLWQANFLPDKFAIVGIGRRDKNDAVFRAEMKKDIAKFRDDTSDESLDRFLANVVYQRSDFTTAAGMKELASHLTQVEQERGLPGNRLFYLATDPDYFNTIVEGLSAVGLLRKPDETAWSRVVIEKPFGYDLASALELNKSLAQFLRADTEIYRIDHYLGKESWCRTPRRLPLRQRDLRAACSIATTSITCRSRWPRPVGMEGRRGAFYDHTGALRDVVQNHMLQLLALVAMDAPATLKARDIGDAKLRVLRDLVPIRGNDVARKVVRGQYSAGTVDGKPVQGFREEEAIAPDLEQSWRRSWR